MRNPIYAANDQEAPSIPPEALEALARRLCREAGRDPDTVCCVCYISASSNTNTYATSVTTSSSSSPTVVTFEKQYWHRYRVRARILLRMAAGIANSEDLRALEELDGKRPRRVSVTSPLPDL